MDSCDTNVYLFYSKLFWCHLYSLVGDFLKTINKI